MNPIKWFAEILANAFKAMIEALLKAFTGNLTGTPEQRRREQQNEQTNNNRRQ